MGRQLHDKPLGQRLERSVILILRQVRTNLLATRHDDSSDMSGTGIGISEIMFIPLPRQRRINTVLDLGLLNGLILWTHIPAIDCERALAIERDERPCPSDFQRIEDQRPGLDLFHLRFQHAKPRVDLVGYFMLSRAFLFQRPILGEQFGMGRSFIIRRWRRITGQGPQAVAVAVGQVKRDLDPLPALNRNRLSLGLELFRHQPIEQGRVLEPATVIALEQVHAASCGPLLHRPQRPQRPRVGKTSGPRFWSACAGSGMAPYSRMNGSHPRPGPDARDRGSR